MGSGVSVALPRKSPARQLTLTGAGAPRFLKRAPCAYVGIDTARGDVTAALICGDVSWHRAPLKSWRLPSFDVLYVRKVIDDVPTTCKPVVAFAVTAKGGSEGSEPLTQADRPSVAAKARAAACLPKRRIGLLQHDFNICRIGPRRRACHSGRDGHGDQRGGQSVTNCGADGFFLRRDRRRAAQLIGLTGYDERTGQAAIVQFGTLFELGKNDNLRRHHLREKLIGFDLAFRPDHLIGFLPSALAV